MIYIGVCLCCGFKVCRRCACCHQVKCDDQVRLCRATKDEKYSGCHAHKYLRGVRRRLKTSIVFVDLMVKWCQVAVKVSQA